VWVVSEGNDQARKVAAIREGINQGKLRAADYRALLAPPAEQKTAQPTGPIEKVELSADDIATIEKIMRSEFEPQIRELTHRLGSRAAEKIIAQPRAEHMARSARGWAGFASQSGGVLRKLWTTCSRG
jgi:hypothetical protein